MEALAEPPTEAQPEMTTVRLYAAAVARQTWSRAALLKLGFALLLLGMGAITAACLLTVAFPSRRGGMSPLDYSLLIVPGAFFVKYVNPPFLRILVLGSGALIALAWIAQHVMMPIYAASAVAPLVKHNDISELRARGFTGRHILLGRGLGVMLPFLIMLPVSVVLETAHTCAALAAFTSTSSSPSWLVFAPLVLGVVATLVTMASLVCVSALCRRKWTAITACCLLAWVVKPIAGEAGEWLGISKPIPGPGGTVSISIGPQARVFGALTLILLFGLLLAALYPLARRALDRVAPSKSMESQA